MRNLGFIVRGVVPCFAFLGWALGGLWEEVGVRQFSCYVAVA